MWVLVLRGSAGTDLPSRHQAETEQQQAASDHRSGHRVGTRVGQSRGLDRRRLADDGLLGRHRLVRGDRSRRLGGLLRLLRGRGRRHRALLVGVRVLPQGRAVEQRVRVVLHRRRNDHILAARDEQHRDRTLTLVGDVVGRVRALGNRVQLDANHVALVIRRRSRLRQRARNRVAVIRDAAAVRERHADRRELGHGRRQAVGRNGDALLNATLLAQLHHLTATVLDELDRDDTGLVRRNGDRLLDADDVRDGEHGVLRGLTVDQLHRVGEGGDDLTAAEDVVVLRVAFELGRRDVALALRVQRLRGQHRIDGVLDRLRRLAVLEQVTLVRGSGARVGARLDLSLVVPRRVRDVELDRAVRVAARRRLHLSRSRGVLGGGWRARALLVRPGVGAVRLHELHRPAVDALLVQRGAVVEGDDTRLDLVDRERNRGLLIAEDLPPQAETVLAVVAGPAGDVLVDVHVDLPTGRIDRDVDVVAVGQRTVVVRRDGLAVDLLLRRLLTSSVVPAGGVRRRGGSTEAHEDDSCSERSHHLQSGGPHRTCIGSPFFSTEHDVLSHDRGLVGSIQL